MNTTFAFPEASSPQLPTGEAADGVPDGDVADGGVADGVGDGETTVAEEVGAPGSAAHPEKTAAATTATTTRVLRVVFMPST
ncbi:hypothetical protein GCM10009617_34760 [Leifsonia poae]|uniref:Uncharacterized protein n=1 Tax=Leifsonia poae TaxID=110933 RepID=A0A9W6H8K7_9MICO|nr:hypothetical protein GCM10017584_15100 [Leifsonia poae]